MTDIAQKIKDFICNHLGIDTLENSSDIFKEGYVNSLFAMQIVNFVENTFEINIANDDLSIDNFRSIEKMTLFVTKQLA